MARQEPRHPHRKLTVHQWSVKRIGNHMRLPLQNDWLTQGQPLVPAPQLFLAPLPLCVSGFPYTQCTLPTRGARARYRFACSGVISGLRNEMPTSFNIR